jgi:integrase
LNNFRTRISSLFAYGVKRGHLDHNPFSAIDPVKSVDKTPEIFIPDQLQLILEKSRAEALPCLAIAAFAGLRTAELLRLEWEEVDLRRGHINVPASVKTRLMARPSSATAVPLGV